MNPDELVQYLKDNLTIELNFEEGGRAYWSGDHSLTAVIKLGNTTICEGKCSLPNRTQENPY